MSKILKYRNWSRLIESNDSPNTVTYYKNGNIESEKWYKDRKSHRENGPAVILYWKSGKVREEKWYIDGKLYREGGPALISYFENGKVKDEKLHKENGPAHIEYFLNDKNREQYGISLMKYVHKRANGLIDDNDNDNLNREVDTEDEVEAPIEKDLSELSKKEIEDKINDALDRGDFEEVKKLSAFIKESHAALTFINWLMLNE
jgi:hypothetical protein